jgi:hypothetical protein
MDHRAAHPAPGVVLPQLDRVGSPDDPLGQTHAADHRHHAGAEIGRPSAGCRSTAASRRACGPLRERGSTPRVARWRHTAPRSTATRSWRNAGRTLPRSRPPPAVGSARSGSTSICSRSWTCSALDRQRSILLGRRSLRRQPRSTGQRSLEPPVLDVPDQPVDHILGAGHRAMMGSRATMPFGSAAPRTVLPQFGCSSGPLRHLSLRLWNRRRAAGRGARAGCRLAPGIPRDRLRLRT